MTVHGSKISSLERIEEVVTQAYAYLARGVGARWCRWVALPTSALTVVAVHAVLVLAVGGNH